MSRRIACCAALVFLLVNSPSPATADDPFPGEPSVSGTWKTIRDGHQLVYLGDDRVLDWEPNSGHYRIWAYDRTSSGQQDPFPDKPAVEGTWRTVRSDHQLVYLGDDGVLHWKPDGEDGRYRIWRYDRGKTGRSNPLQNVVEDAYPDGTWPTSKKSQRLISLEGKRVLDWEPETGHYRIWQYDPKNNPADWFPHDPAVEGTWETIRAGHQLIYVGSDRVLDWEPATGNYRIWTYDRH